MAHSSHGHGRTRRPAPRRLLLVTLLVSLLAAVALLQPSSFAVASPDPVAHANPEALVVPKSKRSAHSDHADVAAKPVKANNQDGDDEDDLTIDTGDDIAELGDPMAPVTTDSPTRTRTGDPEVITDVVADGEDAAVVVEAAALFDDPASDVVDILVPPTEPEHVPGAKVRRDARNIKRDGTAEFTQAVELDKIVPESTDVAGDAAPEPVPTPVPAAPAPGQVIAGRPTSTATRPAGGSSTTSARATSTARPGTGGSGGDSNPDSHSGDQTLEILITDNSAVGTGPGAGTGKGANVDFAVNGFGVSVSGSLKRGAPAPAPQGQAGQVKQTAMGGQGKKAREHK